MTSSPHGLYVQGYTRVTMGVTKSGQAAKLRKSQKNPLSSDRSLQLDCVKLESLVIADQHAAVNTFPGLVTTSPQSSTRAWTSASLRLAQRLLPLSTPMV